MGFAIPAVDLRRIQAVRKGADQVHVVTAAQTGGQPTLVMCTDDCAGQLRHVVRNGVEVAGERFFYCLDLYGNRLTVVELKDGE